MRIRPVTDADLEAITGIYNHYVLDTIVTFEERPIRADEMAQRVERVVSSSLPWLVAEQHGQVAGYAYAAPWHGRTGYRFSAESTVYLDPAATGRGIGRGLYEALLGMLREQGFHVVIGCIALPNDISVALHERLGFRNVAHFHEVGIKFGRWVDVGYWQASL